MSLSLTLQKESENLFPVKSKMNKLVEIQIRLKLKNEVFN